MTFNLQVNLTPADFEPPGRLGSWFSSRQQVKPSQPEGAAGRSTDDKSIAEFDDGAAQWILGWVPPGFELAQNRVWKMRAKMPQTRFRMYSDGIAAFTVFVEQRRLDGAALSAAPPFSLPNVRQGATLAHSRSISATSMRGHDIRGTTVVTVVGDIPLKSAKRILNSFQNNEQ